MVNVRISDELRALIEEAVRESRAKDRSTWMRDALENSARAEIRAARIVRSEVPVAGFHREEGLQAASMLQPSGCQHPPTAHGRTPHRLFCRLCGVTIRSLM